MPKKHTREICRWTRYMDGTGVYRKYSDTVRWELTYAPYWHAEEEYIVEDKWAKIRMAQADGRQLQYIHRENIYTQNVMDRFFEVDVDDVYTDPSDWRVRPKENPYAWETTNNNKRRTT